MTDVLEVQTIFTGHTFSASERSTVNFDGASVLSVEYSPGQSVPLTYGISNIMTSHLSTDTVHSSDLGGSATSASDPTQFPMQMATESVGNPSSELMSSFSITSFSTSARVENIMTSEASFVNFNRLTPASDILSTSDLPSAVNIQSSLPVSMEITSVDSFSVSQSLTSIPQTMSSVTASLNTDVIDSMATGTTLTSDDLDLIGSSRHSVLSGTSNILASTNLDVKRSVSTVDLSELFSSDDQIDQTSQYYVSVSEMETATSFVSPTPVMVSPTQNFDSSNLVSDVDFSLFLSSETHYSALSDNYQSTMEYSGETLQSIRPTTHSSTNIQPMFSSTVAPSLPTVSPSITTDSGNDTLVASTPTPGLGSSFPLVLGISLCGAGILIFLIILLVVCCCKRKTKMAKLDIQPQLQDLWVTTRSEIPMNPTLDTLESVSEANEDKLSNGHSNFTKSSKDETEYKVIYPFQVLEDGQLELDRGDIVIVSEKDENGWWKGAIGDREGWFPGSYVKECKPPPVEKKPIVRREGTPDTNENAELKSPAPVSSFFIGKDSSKKLIPPLRKDSGRLYTPPKIELRARGKEVTIPHLPNDDPTAEKRRSTVSPSKEHFEIEGTKFKVLFNYSPNFKEEMGLQAGEIVTGIVKERNGWMTGRKDRTNEVGWFPAVYVERATQEEVEEAIAQEYGYPDKASVYNQLQVNKSPVTDKDWVGIEHVATCPYASESVHDLSFDIGDKILVFETLVNGWWFGSHGDEVGWFPGSYVEMLEEVPEPEIKYKVSTERLNIATPISNKPGARLSVNSNISKLSVEKSDDEHSLSSVGTVDSKASGRRKPARKAPLPPTENGRSPRDNGKLPTTPVRPIRSAPLAPGSGKMESTPDSKLGSNCVEINIDSGERFAEKSPDVSSISSKSAEGAEKTKKPEIPKRYIKPKLVKVPRKKINLQAASMANKATKSPPPPRPDPPKNILRSPLNKNPENSSIIDSSKDSSHCLDSTKGTYETAPEPDISGIEAINSFNSSVSNGKNDENHEKIPTKTQKTPISTPSKIPKFSKQSTISSENSAEEENSLYSVDDIGEELEKELSQNNRKHSTPKIQEGPTFAKKQGPNVQNNQQAEEKNNSDFISSEVSNQSDSVMADNTDISMSETNVTKISGYEDSILENNKKVSKIPQSPKKSTKLPIVNKEKDSKIPVNPAKSESPAVSPAATRQNVDQKPPGKVSHLQKPKVHYKGNSNLDSGNVSNNNEKNNDMDSSVNQSVENDDIILITDGLDSSTNESNQINNSHMSENTDIPVSPENFSKLPPKSPTPKSKTGASRIPKVFGSNSPKSNSNKMDSQNIPRKTSNTSQDSGGFSDDAKSPSKHKPERPDKPPSVPKGKSPTRKTSASPSRIPKGSSPRKSSDSPSRLPYFKTFHGSPKNNSKFQGSKSSPQDQPKTERGRSSIPVVKPTRPPPPDSPPVKVLRSHEAMDAE